MAVLLGPSSDKSFTILSLIYTCERLDILVTDLTTSLISDGFKIVAESQNYWDNALHNRNLDVMLNDVLLGIEVSKGRQSLQVKDYKEFGAAIEESWGSGYIPSSGLRVRRKNLVVSFIVPSLVGYNEFYV